MTELADRIKDIARELRGPDDEGRLIFNTLYDIGSEVAALQADVVAQRGQNAKLRAALKPFAEYAATLTNWDSDPVIVARWRGVIVTAGDFRKVAEVLGEPPTT